MVMMMFFLVFFWKKCLKLLIVMERGISLLISLFKDKIHCRSFSLRALSLYVDCRKEPSNNLSISWGCEGSVAWCRVGLDIKGVAKACRECRLLRHKIWSSMSTRDVIVKG